MSKIRSRNVTLSKVAIVFMAGEKRTLQALLIQERLSGVYCLGLFVCWSATPAQCLLLLVSRIDHFLTRGDRPDCRWKKELVSTLAWKNSVQKTSTTLPCRYDGSLCRPRTRCCSKASFFARGQWSNYQLQVRSRLPIRRSRVRKNDCANVMRKVRLLADGAKTITLNPYYARANGTER